MNITEGCKRAILKALIELIDSLSRAKILNKDELIEFLSEREVFVVTEFKRLDYKLIAHKLKSMPVFLPIDRKRAYYARRRLEEILGRKVHRRRVRIENMVGYLFYLY